MTTSMTIPISQRLILSEKLHLLVVVEAEGEGADVDEAETILPPSGPPHWSPVRSRNTSRALH